MLSPIRSKKNFAGLSGSTAAQPRVYFQNFAQRTSQGIQPGNVFINQNFGRAFIAVSIFLGIQNPPEINRRGTIQISTPGILHWSIATRKDSEITHF